MATVSAGGDLVQALDHVFASNPQSVATDFCHLLSRVFANILEMPLEEARRKLHTNSSLYQQRIGSVKGSTVLLQALGDFLSCADWQGAERAGVLQGTSLLATPSWCCPRT
jgi:hypothetical protein